MTNKIIGSVLILLSSYAFSFNLKHQYKKELSQIKTLMFVLSDINNILDKFPFSVYDILHLLTDKKYFPYNSLFQNCLTQMKEEKISFSQALNNNKPKNISDETYDILANIALSFELPNTKAIKGKLQLIYSDAEFYKNNLLKDGNEKLELYTKLTKLASVLSVIIFI